MQQEFLSIPRQTSTVVSESRAGEACRVNNQPRSWAMATSGQKPWPSADAFDDRPWAVFLGRRHLPAAPDVFDGRSRSSVGRAEPVTTWGEKLRCVRRTVGDAGIAADLRPGSPHCRGRVDDCHPPLRCHQVPTAMGPRAMHDPDPNSRFTVPEFIEPATDFAVGPAVWSPAPAAPGGLAAGLAGLAGLSIGRLSLQDLLTRWPSLRRRRSRAPRAPE